MTKQELKLSILSIFGTAADLQAYLIADIWPAYRHAPGIHEHNARLHAEALARREARERERIARKEQKENEKLREQGYIQLPDGKWQKPRPGQSAEEVVQEWHDRKAGKPVMMPPAMAAAWDEFTKNKNRP